MSYIISIIGALTLEAYTCNIIKIKRALEDLEKNKLLMDKNNDEEINKSIVENNAINISNIENLKLKELKSLLEIIRKEKELCFDSSIDDSEENNSYDDKPYTLNMKM